MKIYNIEHFSILGLIFVTFFQLMLKIEIFQNFVKIYCLLNFKKYRLNHYVL